MVLNKYKMKGLFALLIIAGILAGLYFAIMTAVAKVSFEIRFSGLDLSGISIQNLLGGSSKAQVKINARLNNKNNFDIKLAKFHIWIYYAGTMIAQSTEDSSLAKILIPATGTVDVQHNIDMYLNNTTLQVIKDLKDKKQLRFDYTASFRVFGFPYTHKDYFNYQF